MAGKFIKGALVEFVETFLLPVPNVIIFQFNPETITHTWTQPESSGDFSNPLAVKGTPAESFSLTIAMDANDMIADGSRAAEAIAVTSGIYSRLAALEMLQYPVSPSDSLFATVSSAANVSISGEKVVRDVTVSEVPTVLFVWGPERIVPVRVTTLTITETLYDSFLSPTHAEAQLELSVLIPEELDALSGKRAIIARTAYKYSLKKRQALALTNLANAAESIIGMLPV